MTQARRGPSTTLALVDALLVLAFTMLAAQPLQAAYSGPVGTSDHDLRWLVAVLGGSVLGLGIAFASARRRSDAWFCIFGVLGAYLLFGSAFATSQATAHVLPNGTSLRLILEGAVRAWFDSLVAPTPLGGTGHVLVVPFVLGLASGLASGVLLWRSRWRSFAALVIVGVFVVSALYGTHNDTFLRTSSAMDVASDASAADAWTNLRLRGVLLVVGLLVWIRWRVATPSRGSVARRVGLTATMLLVATVVGFVSTSSQDATNRFVLRDHVKPPYEPLDFVSPLTGYRNYRNPDRLGRKELFEATGFGRGELIRLATLDTFDGTFWSVNGGRDGDGGETQSGDYDQFVPERTFGKIEGGSTERSVRILDLTGPWIPAPGRVARIHNAGSRSSSVLHSVVADTFVDPRRTGVRTGDEYSIVGEAVRVYSPERDERKRLAIDGSVEPRPGTCDACDIGGQRSLNGRLRRFAQTWIPEQESRSDDARRAWLLAEAFGSDARSQLSHGLRNDGGEFKNDGPSRSGHGVARLLELVENDREMVGDEEQFASAFALLAQEQRWPARVAVGFRVPDTCDDDRKCTIHGADVTAWTEIRYENAGWIAFDPTPTTTQKPTKPNPTAVPPEPIVPPPGRAVDPDESATGSSAGRADDGDDGRLSCASCVRAAAYVAVVGGGTSPIWGILLFKSLRRRRRRRADDAGSSVVGGWRELSDTARDLGATFAPSATRREVGHAVAARYAAADAVVPLAVLADHHVFGGTEPSDHDAEEFWRHVDDACRSIRSAVPRWRRPLAALSPVTLPWREVGAAIARPAHRVAATLSSGTRSAVGSVVRVARTARVKER